MLLDQGFPNRFSYRRALHGTGDIDDDSMLNKKKKKKLIPFINRAKSDKKLNLAAKMDVAIVSRIPNEQQRQNGIRNEPSGKIGPSVLNSHCLKNSETGFFMVLYYV